ncbi:MAG: YggS family pyridoxal phosphate-dependent enzyme [Anaerolineaceae bacterium]|nr:YggS family pyridoxal phosphate-dependent enzyme [Anaerolineaceae bacterium]
MDSLTQDEIRANYEIVCEEIARAAQSAGRKMGDVVVMTVTKLRPPSLIQSLFPLGIRILGENYPEETAEKQAEIIPVPGVEWHMIGHLQSRKAKLVADHFDMMHSIDQVSIARKLDQLLTDKGRRMPVLLELNVGGEPQKHGWSAVSEADVEALYRDIEQILGLSSIELRGLMTMPPYSSDGESSRVYFARLRRYQEKLAKRYGEGHFQELSMGTSSDFRVAVEEGATYVRIGERILGKRH